MINRYVIRSDKQQKRRSAYDPLFMQPSHFECNSDCESQHGNTVVYPQLTTYVGLVVWARVCPMFIDSDNEHWKDSL